MEYAVRGLGFGHGRTPVFDDFDATIPAGAVTAVIGGNGSGKSTLLNLCAGVIRADAGAISPVPSRPALLAQRTEHIDGLPLTVRDCVRIGMYGQLPPWRPFGAANRRAADEMIERVGMAKYRDARMRDLSGGQRQRTMIAQTMVQPADLYLLDEPSAALDTAGRQLLFALLREKADAGKAVLMATHDGDEIAFADQVINLGRIAIRAEASTRAPRDAEPSIV
ncbi:metal ABC transporter ATP-binding protein [Gordonia sp. PKS22-38]|uniref:Metal ABC transporter ATP-binding protein n=1 Tax=Gordonia prachuapensis TaxID=3115651 RepID=A0ABU7MMZ4_9ACTN|nr:metal ABC transporter ATP-binding protein [Gordonia sp. PKS22-38]